MGVLAHARRVCGRHRPGKLGHVEEDDMYALSGEDGGGVGACWAAADDEHLGTLGKMS